jgi:hypothetical protein
MSFTRWTRVVISALPAAVLGGVLLLVPRIPQSRRYHRFADRRTRFGIPNANDVLSNLAFVIAGGLGVVALLRNRNKLQERTEAVPWAVLFGSSIALGAGSGYYHLRPDHGRLVWDRLPMSTAFMAALDAAIMDRISVRAGPGVLPALLLLGTGSVVQWYASEREGRGDLRLYILVQTAPFLTLPLILGLFPARYDRGADWVGAIAWYGAAKVAELLDRPLFRWTGRRVSGHTLKHVFAGLGFAALARMLERRERKAEP